MRVNLIHATQTVTITMTLDECSKLVSELSASGFPVVDADADPATKLEDMLVEILNS
jgi:hypothetical protein